MRGTSKWDAARVSITGLLEGALPLPLAGKLWGNSDSRRKRSLYKIASIVNSIWRWFLMMDISKESINKESVLE